MGVKALIWESVQCLLPKTEEGLVTGIREQRFCCESSPLQKYGKGLVLCNNKVGQCLSQKFRSECDLLVKIVTTY